MDISTIGSSTVRRADYTSSRQQQEKDGDEDAVVLALNQTAISKETAALYKNPKLAGNAQIVARFEEFANKQIGGQLGSFQAFLQGSLGGGSRKGADSLSQLLCRFYGLDTDLDPSAVEEGGYYSAEATSERLVQFAIGISGGDTAKADMLVNAVKKGFALAADVWGGELPDISQRTYELTMEKFDAWKNGTLGEQ
jgi:hypothetical protein